MPSGKTTKEKYANTYLEDFEKLVPFGSDKAAYEARVEEIISSLHGTRRYYVAAFPFYNTNNSHKYNLIHCTSHKEGFKLYKKSARKVFGAQVFYQTLPLKVGSCDLTMMGLLHWIRILPVSM